MKADLHTHTTASDGRLGRDELLQAAAANGVDCIAVTDHDTMSNSFAGFGETVRVLSGCELSTQVEEYHTRAHILCYLPKDTAPLEGYFRRMRDERNRTGEEMIARVHKLFPVVTMESVLRRMDGSGVIYKLHIMRVLIDFGYTKEVYGELYRRLFSSHGGSCFVGNTYGECEELLEKVRAARGVAVFAHPGVYRSVPYVRELARRGLLDGVEIEHPKNSPADKAELHAICREYGLLWTGGTDYHGGNNSSDVMIGDHLTDGEQLGQLYSLSETK